jgi:hypothetical protein
MLHRGVNLREKEKNGEREKRESYVKAKNEKARLVFDDLRRFIALLMDDG